MSQDLTPENVKSALARFIVRQYLDQPILQFGLPKQCYEDMLLLSKAVTEEPALLSTLLNQWIPCSQRMPTESELVLVYTPTTDDVVIAGYDHEDGWTTEERAYRAIEVTHWMPLPADPDKQ